MPNSDFAQGQVPELEEIGSGFLKLAAVLREVTFSVDQVQMSWLNSLLSLNGQAATLVEQQFNEDMTSIQARRSRTRAAQEAALNTGSFCFELAEALRDDSVRGERRAELVKICRELRDLLSRASFQGQELADMTRLLAG